MVPGLMLLLHLSTKLQFEAGPWEWDTCVPAVTSVSYLELILCTKRSGIFIIISIKILMCLHTFCIKFLILVYFAYIAYFMCLVTACAQL